MNLTQLRPLTFLLITTRLDLSPHLIVVIISYRDIPWIAPLRHKSFATWSQLLSALIPSRVNPLNDYDAVDVKRLKFLIDQVPLE